MRGSDALSSYVDLEKRIPAKHPLRDQVDLDEALVSRDGELAQQDMTRQDAINFIVQRDINGIDTKGGGDTAA
jgi:hypothetical protein